MKNAFKLQSPSAKKPIAQGGSASPPFVDNGRQSKFLFWIVASFLVHVGFVGFIALVIQILAFFGYDFHLFDMKPKNKDVEFVLVDNSPKAPPKNPTKNRAEHSSRSGGKKTSPKPTALPQQAAGSPSKKASAPKSSKLSSVPKKASRAVAPQKAVPKKSPQKATVRPSQNNSSRPPAPKKVKTTRTSSSKAPQLPASPVAPSIKMPSSGSPRQSGGGPIVKTPSLSSSPSSGSRGSSGNPGPSMISGAPSRSSGGRSGGNGAYNQSGSPGGGGGRAGIDAVAEPDFGPYIAELQRRIRRNWSPPVEDRSKHVVAYFVIGRDGRLLELRIDRSSGSTAADNAALAAVRASAPFRQLPPNFRGSSIPVQFIFDYETTGHGSAKMR